MPRFAYRAVAAGGGLVEGEIAADNREAAAARLRADGVIPVELRAAEARTSAWPRGPRRRRAREGDGMVFVRQLALMLGAGTPVDRALEILRRTHAENPVGALAGDVLTGLRAGEPLTQAMARRGDAFSALHRGMVHAGEVGGALAPALEQLSAMLERNHALREQARSALTYPLLVLILTGLSVAVLLVYVVPEFRPMFDRPGAVLPLSTRIVIAASDLARGWGWLAAPVLGALALLFSRGPRSPAAQRWRDRLTLSIPLWGDVVRRVETARFCRTLGALAQNGAPLVSAVEIAAGTLGNAAVADAARRLGAPLSRGEGLAGPMARSGRFADLAVELIAVGEETGRLPQTLGQAADVLERETTAAIQRMLALLTPAVTVALGVLIAFIIGALISAILGSYDLAL